MAALYQAMQPTTIVGAAHAVVMEEQFEGPALLQHAIEGISKQGVPPMVEAKQILALGTLKADPKRVKEDLILYAASIGSRIRDSRKGIPQGHRAAPTPQKVPVPLGLSKIDIVHKKRSYRDGKFAAVTRSCLQCQTPFLDPEFPPRPESLGPVSASPKTVEGPNGVICWRFARDATHADHRLTPPAFGGRYEDPGERPSLFQRNHDPDPLELRQGVLGTCAMLSAVAALAEWQGSVRSLFMDTKDSETTGVYALKLCLGGGEREMMIDHCLPTHARTGRPAGIHCGDGSLWGSLIEKAWAKWAGSYDALRVFAQDPGDCLAAMIGTPHRRLQLPDYRRSSPDEVELLWSKLTRMEERGDVVMARPREGMPYIAPSMGYTVIAITEAYNEHGTHRLIALRDPWTKEPWAGEWEPDSNAGARHWTRHVVDQVKQNVKWAQTGEATQDSKCRIWREPLEEGMRWLSLDEFCDNFDHVSSLWLEPSWHMAHLDATISCHYHVIPFQVETAGQAWVGLHQVIDPLPLHLRFHVAVQGSPDVVAASPASFTAGPMLTSEHFAIEPGHYFMVVEADLDIDISRLRQHPFTVTISTETGPAVWGTILDTAPVLQPPSYSCNTSRPGSDVCDCCGSGFGGRCFEIYGWRWCETCWCCRHCRRGLRGVLQTKVVEGGYPVCGSCTHDITAQCANCCEAIGVAAAVHAMHRQWHPECFRCYMCGREPRDAIFVCMDRPVCSHCVNHFHDEATGARPGSISRA